MAMGHNSNTLFGFRWATSLPAVAAVFALATPAAAQDKPNILVIWSDDVGSVV